MKILVIGSGGREHAIAWKLRQSAKCEKLFAVPGSFGMKKLAECVETISPDDNAAIVSFAEKNGIDLAVVGPEAPLVNGLADALAEKGIKVFGPSKAAAEIEGSKAFAKNLMKKYGIPTARYEIFADASRARSYVRQMGAPIVVKADGLAAGKGVTVAHTVDDAIAAIDETMKNPGSRVVIEEFMDGEEASLLAFTDGENVVPMIPAQDHKRAYDGDAGPNTGGMGAYAPAPVMTQTLIDEATEKILKPTIAAMKKEGRLYKGCLYAGLMITNDGPKVVEFNCRFGDPETQVVLPLLSGDLAEIMFDCADGNLDAKKIKWRDGYAVCVVMASGGYPKNYQKGYEITGLQEAGERECMVFHAGTKEQNEKIVTDGGRVLGVVALDDNLRRAVDTAYGGVGEIDFKDAHWRKDIAHRALDKTE